MGILESAKKPMKKVQDDLKMMAARVKLTSSKDRLPAMLISRVYWAPREPLGFLRLSHMSKLKFLLLVKILVGVSL